MISTVGGLAHWVAATAAWRRTRETAGGLADLLLPRACVVCERSLAAHERGVVCGRCWTRVDAIRSRSARGAAIRTSRTAVDGAICSAIRSRRTLRLLGTERKRRRYRARAQVRGMAGSGRRNGDRMARLAWPVDALNERTALVPVPLSPARLRERGFNQSELIARALACAMAHPVWD